MDTRSLNYFIVVAEEKNMSRAATRLHLSPSALTRQIQSLEEEFGTGLFSRTASGVEMTPAGQALLAHARNFRNQLELARRDVLNAGQQVFGKVDIGVFGSAIFAIMPEIMKRFAQAHPGAEMILHNQPRAQQIESLRQGQILVGFDRHFCDEPDLSLELVCQESVIVVLHHDHPLASQRAIQLSDLRGQPLIGPPDSMSMLTGIQTLFEQCGFEPQIAHRADDVVTAATLVGCGFGITLVPASLESMPMPNVVYRPLLTGQELTWKMYCAYRKNEHSPVLQAFLECVRAYRQSNLPRL